MANDRLSQLPVEALVSPTDAEARVSQEPVEVLVSPTTAKARSSQVVVEVLVKLSDTNGELIVAGAGTVVFGGSVLTSGALDVVGSGTLAQAGSLGDEPAFQSDAFQSDAFQLEPPDTDGALVVTGTATLAQAGERVVPGELAVAGTGSFEGTAQQGVFQDGALDIAGSGALVEAGALDHAGALAVTGTGDLAQGAALTNAGALDVTGIGTLAQDGTLGGVTHDGGLLVSGSGALAQAGTVVRAGALAVTGTGTLAGLARADWVGGWPVEGRSVLGLLGERVLHYGIVDVVSSSVGNPTTITAPGHGLTTGDTVIISGHTGSTPSIDGTYTVTVIDEDTFTIPVNVTVAGSGGTAEPSVTPSYAKSLSLLPRAITIMVDGVDVTDDVRYADAAFISQVNGTPGTCSFAVRDLDHTRGFVVGNEVEVWIDGVLQWAGFVRRVRRQYSADVVDTTDPEATARWFLLEGADVNILLANRIVYYKPDPDRAELRPPASLRDATRPGMWREDAPVADVVRYVLTHYTDLLDDGVELSGITINGTLNPDNPVTLTGATTVTDFLRLANRLIGGIFYLTPDRRFIYRDVDVPTTNFVLTDAPDDQDDVGPRDYSFVSDAAKMANDALVWGTAPGVATVAFAREQDPASQTEHGRWQVGEYNTTMYKQTSVETRANALVFGNLQSRKGANVDRLSCEATVFAPVFFLGDIAWCESEVFTAAANQSEPFDDTTAVLRALLPVRRMGLTFPTKTSVRVNLLLTQDLDEPWSIYEFVFPRITIPTPDPPELPELEGGECDETVCGVTDTWSRETDDWQWRDGSGAGQIGNEGTSWTRDGPSMVLTAPARPADFLTTRTDSIYFELTDPIALAWIRENGAQITLHWTATGVGADDAVHVTAGVDTIDRTGGSSGPAGGEVWRNDIALSDMDGLQAHIPDGAGTSVAADGAASGTLTVTINAGGVSVSGSSASDSESGTLDVSSIGTVVIGISRHAYADYDASACTLSMTVEVTGTDGWGTADVGSTWQEGAGSSGSHHIDGGVGVLSSSAADTSMSEDLAVTIEPPVTVEVKFRTNRVESDMVATGGVNQMIVASIGLGRDSPSAAASVGVEYRKGSGVGNGTDPVTQLQFYSSVPSSFEHIDAPIEISADTWYRLKVSLVGGQPLEAKLWLDGTAEPSTWITSTLDAPDTTFERVTLSAKSQAGTSALFTVDYDDLDVEGLNRCGKLLDQFDRAVSQAIQPDLGMSDSGHEWTWAGGDSNGVSMGNGYLRFHGPTSGAGGSGETWNLTLGSGMAIEAMSTFRTARIKFRVSYIHTLSDQYNLVHFELAGDGAADFRAYVSNHAATGRIELNGSSLAKTDWVANVWYVAEMEVAGASLGLKVWRESDPKPTSYAIEDTAAGWLGASGGDGEAQLNVEIDAFAGGNDIFNQTIDVEYLTVDYDGPCYVEGGVPVGGTPTVIPASGPFCETIDHSGGVNMICASEFVAGSAVVYINGRRLFGADYTQNGEEGLVILDTAVSASDTVRICYQIGD